jgi:trans-2,3-dihydro-3-hydroxyanthranilate isomerase
MRRRFVTLDVFTDRRFTGNPLAVVLDAEGLDVAAMQTVAREFNLPETVFVLPPDDPAHRAKLRIFTPARELPFAGHPTVGTAVLLGCRDGSAARRELVLEERVGPVSCTVDASADRGHARFFVPREPVRIGTIEDAARIAAALGLALDDLGCEDFVPESWTAGNPITFVPVRGLEAIGRARPDPARWDDGFGPDDPQIAYLFCRQTIEPRHSYHARMFAPAYGVPEDPATGSAAAAFAGLIAASGKCDDGEHAITIEQGYEMGRPSLMQLTLTLRRGALTSAAIGGDAILVSEGAIEA